MLAALLLEDVLSKKKKVLFRATCFTVRKKQKQKQNRQNEQKQNQKKNIKQNKTKTALLGATT